MDTEPKPAGTLEELANELTRKPKNTPLNELSNKEIAAGLREQLLKKSRKEQTCRWCSEKFVQRRHWQDFCSDRCRREYHAGHHELELEKLKARIATLDLDLAEERKLRFDVERELREYKLAHP